MLAISRPTKRSFRPRAEIISAEPFASAITRFTCGAWLFVIVTALAVGISIALSTAVPHPERTMRAKPASVNAVTFTLVLMS